MCVCEREREIRHECTFLVVFSLTTKNLLFCMCFDVLRSTMLPDVFRFFLSLVIKMDEKCINYFH